MYISRHCLEQLSSVNYIAIPFDQNGRECWCGDEKPDQSKLINDKHCRKDVCTGYWLGYCGGDYTMTVYRLTYTKDRCDVAAGFEWVIPLLS